MTSYFLLSSCSTLLPSAETVSYFAGDVVALGPQVVGDGEDAVVVAAAGQRRREAVGRLVVELDPQGPAVVVDPQRLGERPVGHPQAFEVAERLAGRPAEVGVVPLGLQLHQHDDRQDHLVLVEAGERARIGEEDGGVEHVGARTGRRQIGH